MSSAHAIHAGNMTANNQKKSGFASIMEKIRKYFSDNAYYFALMGASMNPHQLAISKLIDEEGFAR